MHAELIQKPRTLPCRNLFHSVVLYLISSAARLAESGIQRGIQLPTDHSV